MYPFLSASVRLISLHSICIERENFLKRLTGVIDANNGLYRCKPLLKLKSVQKST